MLRTDKYTLTVGLIDGNRLDLRDPDPELIKIDQIANAISKLCRFGGQCWDFYSVAEHCVHISQCYLGENLELKMAGLLHDASEAYMGDLIEPIKCCMQEYIEIEENLQKVIFKKFKIDETYLNIIHREADSYAAINEAQLITHASWAEDVFVPEKFRFPIHNWEPNMARKKFIQTYRDLQSEIKSFRDLQSELKCITH